jgi:hypothetical protein
MSRSEVFSHKIPSDNTQNLTLGFVTSHLGYDLLYNLSNQTITSYLTFFHAGNDATYQNHQKG